MTGNQDVLRLVVFGLPKREAYPALSTGKRDKAEARQVMHKQLGADKLPPKSSRLTLADLRELIEQDYKRHGRRSLPRVQLAFDALLAHFGKDATASIIDTAAVESYADARLKAPRGKGEEPGYSRSTINKELAEPSTWP